MKVILILFLQYFLSSRNKVFWGFILPLVYILLLTYLKLHGVFDGYTKEFWLYSTLGIAGLLITQAAGRNSMKKKRIKELDKINSHDLK